MIRFDHAEYQFADDSGHLRFNLSIGKDGQFKHYWSFEGRLHCVDGPVRRGDLAGHRVLDMHLFGAECSVGHWQELSRATDAKTQRWELCKAVMLIADPDNTERPADIRKKKRRHVRRARIQARGTPRLSLSRGRPRNLSSV